MPSIETLIRIAQDPAMETKVEVRDFATEFNEIVKNVDAVKPSYAAKVLDAAGVEMDSFTSETLASFSVAIDAGIVSDIKTSYDNKFMQAQFDGFLDQRELDYASAVEGDPDFIG